MEPFYRPTSRGLRGPQRFPFHVKLTEKERSALAKLSRRWKMTAADTLRYLLSSSSQVASP